MAVMNQWTVPLGWNGGMEYWNDVYSPFLKVAGHSGVTKFTDHVRKLKGQTAT